jgi:hypothetical protein
VQTSLKPWRLDTPLPKLAPLQGKRLDVGPDSLFLCGPEGLIAASRPWDNAGKVVFGSSGINAFPFSDFSAASSDIFMVKSGIFTSPSFKDYRIKMRNVKKRLSLRSSGILAATDICFIFYPIPSFGGLNPG